MIMIKSYIYMCHCYDHHGTTHEPIDHKFHIRSKIYVHLSSCQHTPQTLMAVLAIFVFVVSSSSLVGFTHLFRVFLFLVEKNLSCCIWLVFGAIFVPGSKTSLNLSCATVGIKKRNCWLHGFFYGFHDVNIMTRLY